MAATASPFSTKRRDILRRPCADPGQKQAPGEWMTQKGIDSSRPVTEEASRAKLNKAHERSHHRSTGNHPAFPAQWFYGLFRSLPGDEFLFVTVIRGLRFCPKPGRAD